MIDNGNPTDGLLDDPVNRRLLDDFQDGFPLSSRPYADMAARLGMSESEVLERLRRLTAAGCVSRVGAVVRPQSIGASLLAAMAVPAERLDAVADLVSACPEVNHNYEREHAINLWFVVTTADEREAAAVIDDIESRTGLPVLRLPLLDQYHIDLGFQLEWERPRA
jgi:DNA-binding Lrp family transcriptional regulator